MDRAQVAHRLAWIKAQMKEREGVIDG